MLRSVSNDKKVANFCLFKMILQNFALPGLNRYSNKDLKGPDLIYCMKYKFLSVRNNILSLTKTGVALTVSLISFSAIS